MKTITSRENSIYKTLAKLASSARERRKTGMTLADGIHLLSACIESKRLPEMVAVKQSSLLDPEISQLLEHFPDALLLSDSLFDDVSPVKTPTGILAMIRIPKARAANSDLAVFLEAIQDPGNLGSILRSAAAAGAGDIFLSRECADAWSPRVLRAAMGAHFALEIHEGIDLRAAIPRFSGKTVALALSAEQSLYSLDLTGKTGFVVGNEGAGISQEILQLVSERAKIPMPGRIESLNAAAAAAVCFFERARQAA